MNRVKIEDFLEKGKAHARPAYELCLFLGTDRRTLTKAINAARRAGAPICASTGDNPGYYLAENGQEMTDYCRSLESRIAELSWILETCQEMAASFPE